MSDLLALKRRKLELMRAKKRILERNKVWNFKPYQWQIKAWNAGRTHKQRLIMAANQVGKTTLSCAELVYHVTGIYPPNWQGYRFNYPINAWALGVSAEQIKKVLQAKILGQKQGDGKFKDGYIPPDLIDHDSIVSGQIRGSVKEVHIKHVKGGYSTLSFISYEQGQHILMGSVVDFALIDEEPRDAAIYPQVLTRTINGAKKSGGLVLLSFTPENGTTELVLQFTEHLKDGQYLQNVTWEDAPHLTDERKQQILAAYPEHQRDMRSKGIPQLGSGAIYPVLDSLLEYDYFDIPAHFSRLGAIDFGYKTNAIVLGAYDRDADIIYIYFARRCDEMLPREISLIMLAQGAWIPWAWPRDGHLPDRGSGLEQKKLYEDSGINMLHEFAQTEDKSVSVEAGITRLLDRMKTGRLRVAAHLSEFFEEKRLYHRQNGLIVKKNDHILDAIRYLECMLRHAATKSENEFKLTKRYIR